MPSILKLSTCALLGLSLSGISVAAVPGDAAPLAHISTLSAFQTGVYHFYDQNQSLYKLGKKAGQSYRLITEYSKGAPKYFSYATTQDWTVRNGVLQRPSTPNSARAVAGNKVNIIRQGQSSGLSVELKAYDVSEQSIAPYLKLQNGKDTKLSEKVSRWAKFAPGSIAYEPIITSLKVLSKHSLGKSPTVCATKSVLALNPMPFVSLIVRATRAKLKFFKPNAVKSSVKSTEPKSLMALTKFKRLTEQKS